MFGNGDGGDDARPVGDIAAARKWILLLNATAAAGQVFIFFDHPLLLVHHVHHHYNDAKICVDIAQRSALWTCI